MEDFIWSLKFWVVDIVSFYEEYEDYKKVIDIYQLLLKDFKDFEDLLKRVGNVYLLMDNKEVVE